MIQNKTIEIVDLGQMPYKEAWEYQENVLQQQVQLKKESKPTQNFLFFVEHSPVYTLGKSGKIEHVLLSENELTEKGIEFYKTNRGGDITYHGPGQIVGYPIIDLENFKTDIGWYLRTLEQIIINAIAPFGLKGERSIGETGVWLDADVKGQERKICAMGVRCSRWVTMHGFALNVNVDLSYFNYIIPCGIENKQVASMHKELNENVIVANVKEVIAQQFKQLFS
jgi:lipoyl(octanoyl) transferase